MTCFKPYTPGESWDSMRERFPQAINELMTSGDDPRVMNDAHVFDFDDGWRMHISRDRIAEDDQRIVVSFGDWAGVPYPMTILASKAAVHFAELSGNRFGQPELVRAEPPIVILAYRTDRTDPSDPTDPTDQKGDPDAG